MPLPAENVVVRVARLPGPGPLTADIFDYAREPIPALDDGDFLLEAIYQPVAAGSRAMLDSNTDYVLKLKPGDGIPCSGAVGRVVNSRNPAFPEGALVRSLALPRQLYHVINPARNRGVVLIDPADGPLAMHVGMLGTNGFTAWLGVVDICRPKPGQTMVVSAAAGAVGSAAGQFARALGARVVGIAGGPEKCRFAREKFGFDECVDYRAPDFAEALKRACPTGIDSYFENVGGEVQALILPMMNDFGRIAMCGQITQYSGQGNQPGPNLMPLVLRRLEVRGFLSFDSLDRMGEFTTQVTGWFREGLMHQATTINGGLDQFHEAVNSLVEGRNIGQQLHQLSAAP